MAKLTTKYIVIQIRASTRVMNHLSQKFRLGVDNLGYTDYSTTTHTLRLKTKRSVDEIKDAIWEVFPEADVREQDPRREA